MERQLEDARNKLVAIRQAKYRAKAIAGMTTDESDGEYYGPPPPSTNQYGYHSPQNYATPSQQQQMQRQQYGSLNRQVGPHNATPTSPSFLNTSSSTMYQGPPPPTSPRPPGHMLTGNAIPRPYNTASSPDSSLPQSPIMPRAAQFNSNLRAGVPPPVPPPPAMMSQVKSNLEACVKDLHEKTFGQSTSPMSTFKASPSKFTTYQSPYEQTQRLVEKRSEKEIVTILIMVLSFTVLRRTPMDLDWVCQERLHHHLHHQRTTTETLATWLPRTTRPAVLPVATRSRAE